MVGKKVLKLKLWAQSIVTYPVPAAKTYTDKVIATQGTML